MTITEFLEARITEDETRAREFEHDLARAMNGDYGNYEAVHGATAQWSVLQRIGYSPARVLAECSAKRAIVEHVGYHDIHVLGALASVYASHPDYRQEWEL